MSLLLSKAAPKRISDAVVIAAKLNEDATVLEALVDAGVEFEAHFGDLSMPPTDKLERSGASRN